MAFNTYIPDDEFYRNEMAKSLTDKIYFMDKVDANVFVDYGCADGVLIEHLARNFPDAIFFGFDISTDMLEKARANNKEHLDRVKFYNDFMELLTDLSILEANSTHAKPYKSCLILSSVIHEVYSYSNKNEIEKFWERVWKSNFNYVAIRDMMVSRISSRPADPIYVARIRQVFNKEKLAEWESLWGSISENWSLTHFLLTYRYQNNWEREVRENYLPINLEDFLNLIPREYFPHYIEHFTLPFIRNCIRKDFGIELTDRTHLKLILRKL